jgi:putative two-component system response regulator
VRLDSPKISRYLDEDIQSVYSAMNNPTDKPVVLVVDDVPENLAMLGDLLQRDYLVRVANSGARALDIAASTPRPDLILLDVMMPDLDGHAVLNKLRADVATRDIPVIFVTAMNADTDEELGFALGAVDYIHKPIRPAVVLARVRTQLELKSARDLLRNQNAWLEAEVAHRMHDNQVVQDVAMRTLASLAETRDNETGNHIRRTQGYVRVLALALAKKPRFAELRVAGVIDTITKAAALHDIGKVGIPDQILLKPGSLAPEEWQLMQGHARLGADAIQAALTDEEDHAPLAFLHIAMDIAQYHHERWDGTGYPDGLKGEAIPLPARLMAVADVFDALISKRVYKPAFPFEKAVNIIMSGKGSHFDPDIIAAFVERLEDFREIAERFADA